MKSPSPRADVAFARAMRRRRRRRLTRAQLSSRRFKSPHTTTPTMADDDLDEELLAELCSGEDEIEKVRETYSRLFSGGAARGDGKRALDAATTASALTATRGLNRDVQEQILESARADIVVGPIDARICRARRLGRRSARGVRRCGIVQRIVSARIGSATRRRARLSIVRQRRRGVARERRRFKRRSCHRKRCWITLWRLRLAGGTVAFRASACTSAWWCRFACASRTNVHLRETSWVSIAPRAKVKIWMIQPPRLLWKSSANMSSAERLKAIYPRTGRLTTTLKCANSARGERACVRIGTSKTSSKSMDMPVANTSYCAGSPKAFLVPSGTGCESMMTLTAVR